LKEDAMDLIDKLQVIAANARKQRAKLLNEAATKTVLVNPFIRGLGYDTSNIDEVEPEYTADVGVKKGEKVDYAILKDGKPIMLFECKRCGADLDREYTDQLYRYFSVTQAKIAVLTDGVIYRFYTDLEEKNKMDQKPFMEFDLMNIQDALVLELKKLTKSAFNLDVLLPVMEELKYTKEIKRILGEQLSSPSEQFVAFFVPRIYSGKKTKQVMQKFTDRTKNAFVQFVNDRIRERFDALEATTEPQTQEQERIRQDKEPVPEEAKRRIVTTPEELAGFYIVRSILREVIDHSRIFKRDTESYFGILLDDNNRKPICRLHFNIPESKYIGLIDEKKREVKMPIKDLDDIFKFSDRLKETISFYGRKRG